MIGSAMAESVREMLTVFIKRIKCRHLLKQKHKTNTVNSPKKFFDLHSIKGVSCFPKYEQKNNIVTVDLGLGHHFLKSAPKSGVLDGLISEKAARAILLEFQKVLVETLKSRISTVYEIRGNLNSYRYCDQVWTMLLDNSCVIDLEQMKSKYLGTIKLISVKDTTCGDESKRQHSRNSNKPLTKKSSNTFNKKANGNINRKSGRIIIKNLHHKITKKNIKKRKMNITVMDVTVLTTKNNNGVKKQKSSKGSMRKSYKKTPTLEQLDKDMDDYNAQY
ncbi:hypothetical protein A3Q56_03128 [Intoshia linei]|uniref:Uncharacterized protein n=1 Tax=Intoshia linei TaxID=1819745 RepID=A0A177B4S0_9BILA|nr:hypothetical protein A3Q56_03128 [Intoshia linei]